MLQLFRGNHFFTSLLLLPLVCVFHAPLFWVEEFEVSADTGYLGMILGEWLAKHTFWRVFFGVLVVFFQAVFINRIAIIHRLNNEISLLPGFLWIAMSAWHPELTAFSALDIAVLLVLVGIESLLLAYKRKQSVIPLFNAGFFFSVATLFYFPLIYLLPFGWFAVMNMRTFRSPEPQQYMVAWVVPYWLAGVYAYLADGLRLFGELQWFGDIFGVFNSWGLSSSAYVVFIMVIIVSLVCVLSYQSYVSKKVIYAQKKIGNLFLYLFFGWLGCLLLQDVQFSYLLLLLWPLTIFLTDSFQGMRNALLSELFIWLFVVISFFFQYQTIF